MIERLSWDSDFFELNVGQLLTEEENYDLDAHPEFDLIYVKSRHPLQVKSELFEQSFGEEKLFFAKKPEKREPEENSGPAFYDDQKLQEDQLVALGLQSGEFSRYKLDPRIKESYFKKLYELWVLNSLNKTFATEVIIYTVEGRAAGFFSFKVDQNIIKAGLSAVDAGYRGKGIGKKMLLLLENYAMKHDVAEIIIPTQAANTGACAFYTKLGYTVQKKEFICHYWKK